MYNSLVSRIYFIGLFLAKDNMVTNITTFSIPEKRPNIDFLTIVRGEKVNNPAVFVGGQVFRTNKTNLGAKLLKCLWAL